MRSLNTSKRYIASDGVQTRYWVRKTPRMNESFALLHPGAAMNHSSLQHLEEGLNKQGVPTIIFDPRRSGYSDHPVPKEYFALERLSEDLEGILYQEGVQQPHLVTHSFGFMPAVDYAARTNNADKITGIAASHNFKETAPNNFSFHLFDKALIHTEYAGSLLTKAAHALRGTTRPACSNQSTPRSELDLWLSIVDIPLKKAASHVVGQRAVNTWDITKQLGKLQTPTLLVYAEKDVMVRPKAATYIKEKTTAPLRVYTLPGGTHSLPITQPKEVLNVINQAWN